MGKLQWLKMSTPQDHFTKNKLEFSLKSNANKKTPESSWTKKFDYLIDEENEYKSKELVKSISIGDVFESVYSKEHLTIDSENSSKEDNKSQFVFEGQRPVLPSFLPANLAETPINKDT